MKTERDDLLSAILPDPVLTFVYITADLGVSKSTFNRSIRHRLPVVQLSPLRLGCLQSKYREFKAALAVGAAGLAFVIGSLAFVVGSLAV